MPQSVYGPEADEKNAPAEDSAANQNTPAGKPYDPRGHDVAANNPSDPRGPAKPSAKKTAAPKGRSDLGGGSFTENAASKATATAGHIKNAFSQAYLEHAEEVSAAYDELTDGESNPLNSIPFRSNNNGTGQRPRSIRGRLARKYRTYLIFSAVLGGITGLIVTAFLILLPLKIESFITNIEDHFMSLPADAEEGEVDNLFTRYMTVHVFPALRSCGARSTAVIDRHCNAYLNNTFTGGTSNPVKALWRGWRNANFENKLATKYQIEFQLDRSANGRRGQWYLKTPGIAGKGDPIGADGAGLGAEFQKASRADLRAAIKTQTRWYNVMIRYKYRRLLDEKYGIKDCVVYCGIRDSIASSKANVKYAAKMFLIERVVGPRNAALASVLSCILLATNGCDGKAPTTVCAEAESTCDEMAGEGETVAAANVEEAVGEASAGFGSETASKLIGLISDVREAGGAQSYAINKVISQFISEGGEDETEDDVPIVGEMAMLNQGLDFVNEAGGAGNKLQYFAYLVNVQAAVSVFRLFQTYADEIHTGHANGTEVGSFTQALEPGDQCESGIEHCSGRPVNGTAGADETPLYGSLISGESSPVHPSTYLCNNGKPVPSGKLVCPEEDLGAKNQTISSIDSVLSDTGILAIAQAYESSPVATVFNALQSAAGYVAGTILSGAEDVLNLIDPSLIASAKSEAGSIFKSIVDDIIPSPFSPDESAGRTGDMIMAGSDASASDYAHTGEGGEQLTPAEAASITQQQENETKQEFQGEPLFAQLFSTSDPDSMISRIAMAMPFSLSGLPSDIVSFLNPIKNISGSFASLFSSTLSAATPAQADPFGITQYGYPPGTIPSHPEAYWNANCSDNPAQGYQNNANYASNNWNNDTTTDPENGQPVNTTTNPCMLIESAVGSAGAIYDSSLLTSDDLADTTGSSGTTGPAPTPSSGNAETIAQQILSNKNIDLTSFSPSVLQDVQDAAAGKPGTAGAMTSAAILNLIETVGQTHKVTITAIQSDGQGHCNNTPKSACPDDPHYNGDAVDFGSLDGVTITGRNPPAITIMKIAFPILPSGSGFGQNECGPIYSTNSELPDGDITFNDTCNHLHVQVPKGTP